MLAEKFNPSPEYATREESMFFSRSKIRLVGAIWLAGFSLTGTPAQGAAIGNNSITRFPIATEGVAMSAAFDGTNYLVGLEYNYDGTENQIDTHTGAQMVSSAGATINPLIETSQHGIGSFIAFDGNNYLMVWEDNQGISPANYNFNLYGQFISKGGAPVGPPFAIGFGIDLDGVNILAYGAGKYLVTYTKLIDIAQGEHSGNRYIAGRIISPNGTMGVELRISTGNGNNNTMIFDGTKYFVAWVEDINDYEVRGRFVTPDGVLGAEISINASVAKSDNPLGVAFDGTNYLVTWNDEVGPDEWDVFGQRVKPDGTLEGSPITITSEPGQQMGTSLAFDGTNYFAVWTDMQNDTNKNFLCDAGENTCWDVYGRYISKAGNLVGNKMAINADAENQIGFVTGFNSGKYLILVSSGIQFGYSSIIQAGAVTGVLLTPTAPPAPNFLPALPLLLLNH